MFIKIAAMVSKTKLIIIIDIVIAKTSVVSMWTFAVCKAEPMALLGKQRISAATTTFQLKPKALNAPEKKYGSIEGIYKSNKNCFFEKL